MLDSRRCSWALLSFVICVAATPVSATVLLPADFSTKVTESDVIVHGRVVEVRSALVGPQRLIESVVTVAVAESLKGAAGSTVTFRVPNGQVGRYRRIVVGAPEFAEGDEVVLFLRGRAPAMPVLFGLSQGVYRVTRDEAARAVVTAARRSMSVDAFAREVHAVLERTR